MGKIAIRADRLSKQYKISAGIRHDTLRDHVTDGLTRLFRIGGRIRSSKETIWALRDVSFEVEQGDIVGIIGRNGAGKSTLLKVLSRIVEPTSGRAEIYGRVGSLLDVGTGFHPELTGRENIYLNASILGFRRREIQRRFDEVVAFSGIEKFIDTPVKRYSSGMYIRLAFAVAAHLDPDVLIVDEVLAVGDAAFQSRCLGKIGEVARSGRTVLFVSHAMGTLVSLCNTGVWLDRGQIVGRGEVEAQVRAYLSAGTIDQSSALIPPPHEPSAVTLRSIGLFASDGTPRSEVDFRFPCRFDITYEVTERATDLHIAIALVNEFGSRVLFTADQPYTADRSVRTTTPGVYQASVEIPGHLLMPGRYYIDIGANLPGERLLHSAERCLSFTIVATDGVDVRSEDWGMIYPNLQWRTERLLEPGRDVAVPSAACIGG
jgi:lipopolysaccharide transport system ATP-binding protein